MVAHGPNHHLVEEMDLLFQRQEQSLERARQDGRRLKLTLEEVAALIREEHDRPSSFST